jgi:hypothetical protein
MAVPAAAETFDLDRAVTLSTKKIESSLDANTRIAVIDCASRSEKISAYILDATVASFVESGKCVVLEREQIDLVKKELDFQLSGDVSDESAQSIGKMLGAEVIVTIKLDDASILRVKAIAVETARILALSSFAIEETGKLESLENTVLLVMDCVSSKADTATALTVNQLLVSAVSSAESFRAVSNESRERAIAESSARTDEIDELSRLARLGRLTEADEIISSRISRDGGLLFLSLTRVNAKTGTIASSVTETYRSEGTLLEGARGQALKCLGISGEKDNGRIITVSNMTELLKAIGSDRVIKLKAGTYDLSAGFNVKNDRITWVNEYDGPCPVIKSVSNLSFIAEGEVTLVIKPAYGWVFSFETCSNISMTGLTLGHTVPGYCLGGVLRFKNCDAVNISSCDLYGSGTYGIGLERVDGFFMENSVVHDCTYGLMTIEDSSDITFASCAFRDTGEFDLVSVNATDHLLITDCEFSGNWGYTLFDVDGESRDMRVVSCIFTDNDVENFASDSDALGLESPSFAGNSFAVKKTAKRR